MPHYRFVYSVVFSATYGWTEGRLLPCAAGRGGEGLSISGKVPDPMTLEAQRRLPARGLRLRRTQELINPVFQKAKTDIRFDWSNIGTDRRYPCRHLRIGGVRRPPNCRTPLIRIFHPNVWQNFIFLIARALTRFRNILKEFYYSRSTARTCVGFPGSAYYSNGAQPHCRRTCRTPPKSGALPGKG